MVISIKHIDLYQIEEYLINKGEVIANIWELNNDGNPNDFVYVYKNVYGEFDWCFNAHHEKVVDWYKILREKKLNRILNKEMKR